MSFENDIFISYAHIDDMALVEGQKGWISSFHRALEIRLGQLLGRTPRIWRDPKLQGNDAFADRLVDRLPGVAILVSVVSPRYMKSDWCLRELREFTKAAAQHRRRPHRPQGQGLQDRQDAGAAGAAGSRSCSTCSATTSSRPIP